MKKYKEWLTRTNSFLHQCAGIEAHPLTQGFYQSCSWLGCRGKPINSTHVMRFALTHICYEVWTLEFSVKAIWLHLYPKPYLQKYLLHLPCSQLVHWINNDIELHIKIKKCCWRNKISVALLLNIKWSYFGGNRVMVLLGWVQIYKHVSRSINNFSITYF